MSVLSRMPFSVQGVDDLADLIVHRRDHGGIGPALRIGDGLKAVEIGLRRLKRRVGRGEGEVEEEGRCRIVRLDHPTASSPNSVVS